MKLFETKNSKIIDIEIKDNFKIYLCGPTLYDDVHIGNLRPVYFTDIFIQYLKIVKNINVIFIHNLTDIDDKIINKSISKKINLNSMVKNYTDKYNDILSEFIMNKPDLMPNVTDHINDIELYIKDLLEAKKAYIKEDGIYFDLKRNLEHYGEISKQKTSNLMVSNIEDIDFSVWKYQSDKNSFDSKILKRGRPGWHTECSTLINKYADSKVDLHIGGMDLKFPHHENERIQSISLYNHDISKYWFHIGQLNIGGRKMSKSLDNIIYAKNFKNDFSFNVLKYIFLTSNFNKPLNLKDDYVNFAIKEINKIERIIKRLPIKKVSYNDIKNEVYIKEFIFHIENNFNVANITTVISQLVKSINKTNSIELVKQLSFIINFLGINYE